MQQQRFGVLWLQILVGKLSGDVRLEKSGTSVLVTFRSNFKIEKKNYRGKIFCDQAPERGSRPTKMCAARDI